LPERGIESYTQALMDLGATVCTRNPACDKCPVKARCVARKTGRIAELPAPRPRKALPLRKTKWLVHVDRGKVLLERRPSPGIWGGLWCFPEAARAPGGAKKLAPIDHGFTHFRLRIQPFLCKSGGRSDGLWIDLDEARDAAVPTPVRNLLEDLTQDLTG
jgi:A/G-specific adenine glycosylase